MPYHSHQWFQTHSLKLTLQSALCCLLVVNFSFSAGCSAPRTRLTHKYEPAADKKLIVEQEPCRLSSEEVLQTNKSTHQVASEESATAVVDGEPQSQAILPVAFRDEHAVVAPATEISTISASSDPAELATSWSLDQLETIALQQNPAILQASASSRKAVGYRNQVGLKPNPVIGYQGQQLANVGTDQHLAFVEQDIVMGDKLQKNRSVLNQEIQSQLWEVETQRVRVVTDVRTRFYEALAAQRRRELAAEFEKVASKGVQFAEARMRAKEGTRPEVLQAEIQLMEVQLQRRNADAEFRGAWTQLMALAGMGDLIPGTLDGQLSVDSADLEWATIQNQILASSPELQGARARFARARANLDRQQAQAVPNLSLSLGAGQDNGTGSSMINTQISIPIPVHNQNQGNITAAHAEYCRASHDVHRTEQSILSRLAETRRDFEVSAAKVLQYEQEILPRAKETLTLAESAYEAGEFDFLQVLIVRRTYFDSNIAYVAAQVDLARATALVNGSVLSGGLEATRDTEFDSGLRDQALTGQ
jgi:cobalt-zinc-cadmium efflux system outer membrane protein